MKQSPSMSMLAALLNGAEDDTTPNAPVTKKELSDFAALLDHRSFQPGDFIKLREDMPEDSIPYRFPKQGELVLVLAVTSYNNSKKKCYLDETHVILVRHKGVYGRIIVDPVYFQLAE